MKRPSPPDLSLPRSFDALRVKLKAHEDAATAPSEDVTKEACVAQAPKLCIQAGTPTPIVRYFRTRYIALLNSSENLRLLVHRPEIAPPEPSEQPTDNVEPPANGGWGYVAKWGRWGYYSRYEDLEVIVRLAGSECMRLFYEEIFRNDKGRYMYAANIEGEDADSRQDAAVIKLLDTVVKEAARAVIMPPTIVEAKQRYQELHAMHLLLLRDMDDFCFDKADSEVLRAAAMIYSKRGAERYEREVKFATVKKSSHSRDRKLVIQIGDTMQRLFGQKMSGTIARLATVATGRTITKEAVKKWL